MSARTIWRATAIPLEPRRRIANRTTPTISNHGSNEFIDKETTSLPNTTSGADTLMLLAKHAKRHGISMRGSAKVAEEVSETAASILMKKLDMVEIASLLEKTSEALSHRVPMLSAVPERIFPIWQKQSNEILGINSSYKMESKWSDHGGSPLTHECMNMEKMAAREKEIERNMKRRAEKKRKGLIKFQCVEDADGFTQDLGRLG
jgi:hypothetical protein